MANFSIVIVPTKKLANGRHRIRIAVAHRSKTRYIPTQFTLDSASQLKNGRVIRHENAANINSCLRRIIDEYEEILEGTKRAQITSWWDRAADIIPSNSGKGIAVMDVLDYYGISREKSIAFGDGKNDIEMLRAVGIGVAMGNSCTEVKDSADESCLSVEEDGIYHYFLERNMIEAI